MRVETSPREYRGMDKDKEGLREGAVTMCLLTRRQEKFRAPLKWKKSDGSLKRKKKKEKAHFHPAHVLWCPNVVYNANYSHMGCVCAFRQLQLMDIKLFKYIPTYMHTCLYTHSSTAFRYMP